MRMSGSGAEAADTTQPKEETMELFERPHSDKRLFRIVLALVVAAGIAATGAACGGDDDDDGVSSEDTTYGVLFSDGFLVAGSQDAWGDALQPYIDSGEVTCEEEEPGDNRCNSDLTYRESKSWIPDGLLVARANP